MAGAEDSLDFTAEGDSLQLMGAAGREIGGVWSFRHAR